MKMTLTRALLAGGSFAGRSPLCLSCHQKDATREVSVIQNCWCGAGAGSVRQGWRRDGKWLRSSAAVCFSERGGFCAVKSLLCLDLWGNGILIKVAAEEIISELPQAGQNFSWK